MQEQIKEVRAKVDECIAKAEATFGIKMPSINVRFDLRGKAAGQASAKRSWGGETSDFALRFNRQHIAMGGQTYKHIVEDVVAHEVAHTVCQAFPQYGKNHNNGWKRVCIALGGNGSRCYSDTDAPEAVAKQSPYVYTTSNNFEVRVSQRVHNKIQRGASYSWRNGKGSVTSDSAYKFCPTPTANELGEQAQTEQTIPPVTKAPKAPKKPVTQKTRTVAGFKTKTNAECIREHIAAGATYEECVAYGVNVLGMKRGLARTYVKNNWNKA